MKKKTVYVAFDGKEFSKINECEFYEERLHDIYCPDYKPNWNNEWESKFYIFYNIPYKKYQYSVSYWTPYCLNIYFNSEETAEKVCEILNKEIKNE